MQRKLHDGLPEKPTKAKPPKVVNTMSDDELILEASHWNLATTGVDRFTLQKNIAEARKRVPENTRSIVKSAAKRMNAHGTRSG